MIYLERTQRILGHTQISWCNNKIWWHFELYLVLPCLVFWNAQFPLLSPQLRTERGGRTRKALGMGIQSLMKRTTLVHPPISILCIKATEFLGRNVTLEFRHCYISFHQTSWKLWDLLISAEYNNVVLLLFFFVVFLDFLTPETCGVAIMMVTSKVMWVHGWRPAYPWVPPAFLYPSNSLRRSLLLLWLLSPSSTPINNLREHTRDLVRVIALTFFNY